MAVLEWDCKKGDMQIWDYTEFNFVINNQNTIW